MAIKTRPNKIRVPEDTNSPQILERNYQHYDEMLRALDARITALENTSSDHETRITTLEP